MKLNDVKKVYACQIIIGTNTTLGNALGKLQEAGVSIPPPLISAFEKIYGYTNVNDGIRHAYSEVSENNIGEEDARFMLISCSAFVNYLISKAQNKKFL